MMRIPGEGRGAGRMAGLSINTGKWVQVAGMGREVPSRVLAVGV